MHLTKSLFVDYMDYPKLAWWKVNNPAIYKKIRKIETEEQEENIMQIGQVVEDKVREYLESKLNTKAMDLMPRYHKMNDEESDDDDEVLTRAELDLPKAINDTLHAIRAHIPVLYQPTFQYGDCLVRADFMVWNGEGYDLIEAKAKSGIRKSVKDGGEDKKIGVIERKFIHDISFQAYVINHVLTQHGLGQVGSIYLYYLNKDYIKLGDLNSNLLIRPDEANKQFEIEVIQRNKPTTLTIDDTILSNEEIEKNLSDMRKYLILSEDAANKQFLRKGTRYLEYFGEDKPFGTIMGMGIHHSNASYIQDLYFQGSVNLGDLTSSEIDGFNNNAQQFIAQYLQCKKTGYPIINHSKIKEVFAGFQYPICFYDYESISVPVPILDHTRPYMQTVVQYSLHKYYEDGTMKHYGGVFVGEGDYSYTPCEPVDNPNQVDEEHDAIITGSYKNLLEQMIADIGDDLQKSTFIVWHEGFENTRNKEIAKLFPDLADAFLTINERTYDLKRVVSDGYYFNPACKGSASIKKVLPVLVPSMNYESLTIGRGDIAMRVLHDLIVEKITDPDIRHKTACDLLVYCGQDTLAMVRIFEAVRKMI